MVSELLGCNENCSEEETASMEVRRLWDHPHSKDTCNNSSRKLEQKMEEALRRALSLEEDSGKDSANHRHCLTEQRVVIQQMYRRSRRL